MRVRRFWFDVPSVLIGLIFLCSAAVVYLGLIGNVDLPHGWRIAAASFFVILGVAFSAMSCHLGRTYQRLHEETSQKH
jgi:hypothetical protein